LCRVAEVDEMEEKEEMNLGFVSCFFAFVLVGLGRYPERCKAALHESFLDFFCCLLSESGVRCWRLGFFSGLFVCFSVAEASPQDESRQWGAYDSTMPGFYLGGVGAS